MGFNLKMAIPFVLGAILLVLGTVGLSGFGWKNPSFSVVGDTFYPTADLYARSETGDDQGTANAKYIGFGHWAGGIEGRIYEGFVKFDLSAVTGTIGAVMLTWTPYSFTPAPGNILNLPNSIELWSCGSNWDETMRFDGPTFVNRPSSIAKLATISRVWEYDTTYSEDFAMGTSFQVWVQSCVGGQCSLCFQVNEGNGYGMYIYTKDQTNTNFYPTLVIDTGGTSTYHTLNVNAQGWDGSNWNNLNVLVQVSGQTSKITPAQWYNVPSGSYIVTVPASYGSYEFYQWDDGSISISRSLSLMSDKTLTAFYSTADEEPPVPKDWWQMIVDLFNDPRVRMISVVSGIGFIGVGVIWVATSMRKPRIYF